MAEKALAVANNYWHREFGRALRYIYRDFEIISDQKLTVKSSIFPNPLYFYGNKTNQSLDRQRF